MPIRELLRYIDRVKAQYIKSFIMGQSQEETHRLATCLLLLRQSLEETIRENDDLIREVS